jgi:hypothetical protein
MSGFRPIGTVSPVPRDTPATKEGRLVLPALTFPALVVGRWLHGPSIRPKPALAIGERLTDAPPKPSWRAAWSTRVAQEG